MGCFSYTCSVSGLPIGLDTPVRFMALAGGVSYRSRFEISSTWQPLALPIRARYDDYGSVHEIEAGDVARAFFSMLNRRAIEQAVGENPWHDLAVTRGMHEDDWLAVLWKDRVQIKGPNQKKVDVVQTMIREDVWQFFVESNRPWVDTLRSDDLRTALRLETFLESEILRDQTFDAPMRELYAVSHALRRLGRPWARGTCCGPQSGDWEYHGMFTRQLVQIVAETPRDDFEHLDPEQDAGLET